MQTMIKDARLLTGILDRIVDLFLLKNTDDRGQKTDDRGQKTDDREQKTENR
jgi:hypothetical protein